MTNNSPQIRDGAGRFLPGISGNPGGRPVGLSGLIREATDEGTELVDFMLGLFRGEHGEDMRTRADAATWLADRGFGKPTITPAVDDDCQRCIAHDVEMAKGSEDLMKRIDLMIGRMNIPVESQTR
ncbi:MAG: hypothetical protein O2974_11435 [Chloroflexi bacterium]|nr:hypothetical protein [Chloroflexota bacterium]